jgi:hypothetical protein
MEFVILNSIYVAEYQPRGLHLRSDVTEDFLISKGLQRPSQLEAIADQFDLKQLVYFLGEVCKEQTLDTWVEFSSSQDVASERVEICRLVTELMPESKDVYQAEIREIMQRLQIKKRLREIDQSKIYVDIESVKRSARNDLKDSFARYEAFLDSGMSTEDKEIRKKTAKILLEADVNALVSLEFPRHEMSALFETMIVRLRNEFVSNNQHGLDGYLSVRISHNTLAGQLWSFLENEHLLVYRDAEKDGYKTNEFWTEQLGIQEHSYDGEIIQSALGNLTKSYDKLVTEIRKEWIQVRKSSDGSGMIDFRLTELELGYLSIRMTPGMSMDTFIEQVIDYFFTFKLEPSLARIRERLQEETKPRINDLLISLQTSCDELNVDSRKLRSAIGRARTNSQITIDRIAEWFRLSRIEKREPFSIDEAISICDASIKTACSDFSFKHNPSEEMNEFKIQGNLTSFVDLIFIAFDNVVRRSGELPPPVAKVYSEYSIDRVRIRIENDIAASVWSEENQARIDQMRAKVEKEPFSKSVNQEGGTGFYKMHKILHHDFSVPDHTVIPGLDFGFMEKTAFFVEFTIPILTFQTLEDDT